MVHFEMRLHMAFGKEVGIMSTIKPIQATPELSGKDAIFLLKQTSTTPTNDAIRKNEMLRGILKEIRK